MICEYGNTFLETNRNLFSRLYVASQCRDGNLNEFFSHENQPRPLSLSARGNPKLGAKSRFVRCLEDATEEQHDVTSSVDVIVLDEPAMLRLLKLAAGGTFREYTQDAFLSYVEHQLRQGHRIYVLYDNYRPDSLKVETLDTRGKLIRRRVEPNNAVKKNRVNCSESTRPRQRCPHF